ncbi:hypothetical protein G7Z17_g7419 [Cylindrodendrum hubeiense]|uniref:Uncharacterized protein n=1 Tax=Cylindrodendrum hubeiense TaxID=595255 RepID=A0A9P5H316_9HYPO|nr:hypothetical protein G7Z17_g7419 [Cylindrodendrum hubeiense]
MTAIIAHLSPKRPVSPVPMNWNLAVLVKLPLAIAQAATTSLPSLSTNPPLTKFRSPLPPPPGGPRVNRTSLYPLGIPFRLAMASPREYRHSNVSRTPVCPTSMAKR